MTSIMTNVSAMMALQTLQTTNQAMDMTQGRIATGYRVAEAKDNAAYWSIATTMRSDNQAMSAVADSLGIGSATVDAAYTGLTAAKDVLNQIKAQLTTATGDGVDKSKVQANITALKDQLKTIADSASFSGQNWLSTGGSTAFSKQIVSSLSRDADNKLSVGNISVDITKMRLFGDVATGGTQAGILDKQIDLETFTVAATAVDVDTTETQIVFADPDNDKISFSISQGGAPGRTIEINANTLKAAGITGDTIRSTADLVAVYNQALKDADVKGVSVEFDIDATLSDGVTANPNVDKIVFSSTSDFVMSAATLVGTEVNGAAGTAAAFGLDDDVSMDAAAGSAGASSVADINITVAGLGSTDIQNFMRVVDEALSQVTTAASDLGAVQNRIELQTNFVNKLMDTIDKGVGTLVDADMTEESTRLKALQTQQQLGVQALSIANTSTQSILQLFR